MIRNDLMEFISESNLDLETFLLDHRSTDPENYRVGEINGCVICYNEKTNLIMDYFYDDCEEEYFDVFKIFPSSVNTVNKFVISRTGQLFKVTTAGTMIKKKLSLNSSGYPRYSIPMGSYEHTKHVTLHRILGLLFIPRLDIETQSVIDHIDRDKLNYALSNLRWTTPQENNKNKNFIDYIGNFKYEAYLDPEKTRLVRTYTSDELLNSEFTREGIKQSFRRDGRYKKFYWKIIDVDVESYLREGELIDETQWVLHYNKSFYVHPLGLIKTVNKSRVSVGTFHGTYRRTKWGYVHKLVAEVFLNNNKKIPPQLQVDHLDTDRLNNRVTNLKICTRIENLNNELTRNKLAKRVLADGKEYDSISQCAEAYNLTRQAILYKINSKYQPNFKFI